MARVILQPCSNQKSKDNYVKTIENPVMKSMLKDYFPDQIFNKIQSTYHNTDVYIWGINIGNNEINKKKWDRIQDGDIVLFARNKQIFASGIVTFKFNDFKLAEKLWGTDDDNNTWELLYFLKDLKQQAITYEDFNDTVGYDKKYIIQGFNVLDEEKSSKFIDKYNFQ